jgi:hypothetical protein
MTVIIAMQHKHLDQSFMVARGKLLIDLSI